MRMDRADFEHAMTKDIEDSRCLHGVRVGVIPTPDGPMFILRIVAHGDPGPDSEEMAVVPVEDIQTIDFGMNMADFTRLADEVAHAGYKAMTLKGSEN